MHTFTIDRAAGLIDEVFQGEVEPSTVKEADEAILAHPDYTRGLRVLTDLREARILFGYKEMSSLVRYELVELHIARQAFVVESDEVYGMIRMFLTLADDQTDFQDARIFRNREEALEWLNS